MRGPAGGGRGGSGFRVGGCEGGGSGEGEAKGKAKAPPGHLLNGRLWRTFLNSRFSEGRRSLGLGCGVRDGIEVTSRSLVTSGNLAMLRRHQFSFLRAQQNPDFLKILSLHSLLTL